MRTSDNDRVNRNIKTFLETCGRLAECGPNGDKLESYYRSLVKSSETMKRNINTGATTATYVYERLAEPLEAYSDNEFMQSVLVRIERTSLFFGLMIEDDVKLLKMNND